MIVVLDTKCLVRWASDGEDSLDRARLDHLLVTISTVRGRVVLPTPVVAEFLVRTDEATAAWLAALERKAAVLVAPFDRRAAFECALLDAAALKKGDKKGGRKDDPWQRIKVDRQIVAIARVAGASHIVTDDVGLAATSIAAGLQVTALGELDAPASALQGKLDLKVGPDELVAPVPDGPGGQTGGHAANPLES